MVDKRLLKGVDIFVLVPTSDANVDTLSTDDGSLLRGDSESFCSNAKIWTSHFPTHRCLDGLSEHTL